MRIKIPLVLSPPPHKEAKIHFRDHDSDEIATQRTQLEDSGTNLSKQGSARVGRRAPPAAILTVTYF